MVGEAWARGLALARGKRGEQKERGTARAGEGSEGGGWHAGTYPGGRVAATMCA